MHVDYLLLRKLFMKKINFIKTVDPQQQQSLHVWFIVSCIGAISCLIVGAGITSLQWMLLQSLNQEKKAIEDKLLPLQTYITRNKALHEQERLIRTQLAHIERYTKQPKSPCDNLACIEQTCGSALQSVEFNNEQLTLTIVCPDALNALSMVEKLSQTNKFKNVALVDLRTTQQQTQKQTLCTIKGIINSLT